MTSTKPQSGALNKFLNVVETLGNKLPNITMLFIYALILTLVVSFALSIVGFVASTI